jgi:hypothetical protein
MLTDNLSTSSPSAMVSRKLMYAGVVALSAVNLLLIWFALDRSSKDNIFIYIFCAFIFFILLVYLKRDALITIYFNVICYLFLWIQCVLYPYLFFQSVIPKAFDEYCWIFSIGFFSILIRHFFIMKYSVQKAWFSKQQHYLQHGVVYMSYKTKNKPMTLKYYNGSQKSKIAQAFFDLISTSLVIFVIYKWGVIIFQTMPFAIFKQYILICSGIVLAISLAALAKIFINGLWILASTKKSKNIRFVFASDDA